MIKRESGNQRKKDYVENMVTQIIGKRTVQQKEIGEAMEIIYLESLVQVQILQRKMIIAPLQQKIMKSQHISSSAIQQRTLSSSF